MCDKAHYDVLDRRVTDLEAEVREMRGECRDGFAALGRAVNDLGHDFGARMNAMDVKLVEEKVKWGETVRAIVIWSARVILLGCGAAMGMTAYRLIFGARP